MCSLLVFLQMSKCTHDASTVMFIHIFKPLEASLLWLWCDSYQCGYLC